MTARRSIWRTAVRILLGYQALVAAAVALFGAWIALSPAACTAQCRAEPEAGLVLGLLGFLGFVWLGQALVAGTAVVVLFVLTTRWKSLGAAVANIIVEAVLLFNALGFLDAMGPFGVPEAGRYALGAAIGAAVAIILLSTLDLFTSDRWRPSHQSIVVACLAAIPFVAASIPGLAGAYSSAQIGSDGFPVGPVTAQFVQDRGSKLPLAYPGSSITYTNATAESKTFNRYRMASWEERMANNGRQAVVDAWYQQSTKDAGWHEIPCGSDSCQMIFVRGSRECLRVLVTSDGAGEIVINYLITPSAKPLSGDQTADQRYCAGQY